MNKELLNICYKYFNRFINSNELLDLLKGLSSNEDIDEIISNVEQIIEEVPNVKDEYVTKKKEKLKSIIDIMEQVPESDSEFEFIHKSLDNMKKKYDKEVDSQDRWYRIVDYINNNDYFNKCYDSLNDYELLEFICQNISAPFPPQISKDEFNRLVKVGIEHDEREWLWRLAFNYENGEYNFDQIADYYLEVKDGKYISELIDIVGDYLDIDSIIDRIHDKQMIEDINAGKTFLNRHISEEQFKRLNNKKDI